MFEANKTSVILSKLTRLTFEGKLIWKLADPPAHLTSGTNSKFPYYAEAKYKNEHYLGYFEERYRSYSDEFSYEWGEVSRLVLLDKFKRTIYTFPQTTALRDLSQSIHESTAQIDDVFSDLLKDFDGSSADDIPF